LSKGNIKIDYKFLKVQITLPHINNLETNYKVSDAEIKSVVSRISLLKDKIKNRK
jgi:hypothetical protein